MWHKIHAACIVCEKTDFAHAAGGKCGSCYMRAYRETHADRVAGQKREWYFKHHKANLAKRKVTRELSAFAGNREAALVRAGHACERCGRKQQLTVHHKDRTGRGSDEHNNSLRNLLVLCRGCHAREHHAETVAAKKGGDPDKWSIKFSACVACLTTSVPHLAKGRCRPCYARKAWTTRKEKMK